MTMGMADGQTEVTTARARRALARNPLRVALEHAVLAPSTHNTQPWRFRVRAGRVDVFTDPRRALSVIDPSGRQQIMSVGAALYNLRVALRRFGVRPEVEAFPDPLLPDLVARVTLGGQHRPSGLDLELFEAIPRRRTNRQPFSPRPVSFRIVDELASLAELEGATLTRLHPRAKAPLAEVITLADRAQFGDRAFRRELTRWLVPWGSRRRDGIPFAKKEYGSTLPVGPMMVRTFDIGGRVAAKERDLATGSPVLIVLGSPGDQREDWLAVGQALEAVLLRGTCFGLSASFLNQPLELGALRPRVAELAGGATVPQLVLRMGYGPPVREPTPRRPLAAVLVED
jgi:hypothetical protein